MYFSVLQDQNGYLRYVFLESYSVYEFKIWYNQGNITVYIDDVDGKSLPELFVSFSVFRQERIPFLSLDLTSSSVQKSVLFRENKELGD
jgi:hypothetical protein